MGPLPIPISPGTAPILFSQGANGAVSLQLGPETWRCPPRFLCPFAHPGLLTCPVSPTIRTQPNSDPLYPSQLPHASPFPSPGLFSTQNSCQLMAFLCSGPYLAPYLLYRFSLYLFSPVDELTLGPLYLLFLFTLGPLYLLFLPPWSFL